MSRKRYSGKEVLEKIFMDNDSCDDDLDLGDNDFQQLQLDCDDSDFEALDVYLAGTDNMDSTSQDIDDIDLETENQLPGKMEDDLRNDEDIVLPGNLDPELQVQQNIEHQSDQDLEDQIEQDVELEGGQEVELEGEQDVDLQGNEDAMNSDDTEIYTRSPEPDTPPPRAKRVRRVKVVVPKWNWEKCEVGRFQKKLFHSRKLKEFLYLFQKIQHLSIFCHYM